MLEALKQAVWAANMELPQRGLVTYTWGNVSGIDREKGLVVIKPSGVGYDELTPENLVVLDLDGNRVEGELNPSSEVAALKVEEYLLAAKLFCPRWDAAYAGTLLKKFGLDTKKRISKLSKGQMSMVTITAALASRAPVTILDEPAAGLDVVENEFGLYYYDHKNHILRNRELALLRSFPNVTVSHHMAFYTDEEVKTVIRDSLTGCRLVMDGKENPWEVL